METKVFVSECSVGKGVFAARRFLPGDLILTLRGQRVNREDPIHFTPLASNLLQTGASTYINPEQPGVYVNHSCDPNAGISMNRRLVALREIVPQEEIRFDYSTTMDDGIWSMDCRCGAPACRRQIVDFRDLPPSLQDHYLKLGMVSGFIARRYPQAISKGAVPGGPLIEIAQAFNEGGTSSRHLFSLGAPLRKGAPKRPLPHSASGSIN